MVTENSEAEECLTVSVPAAGRVLGLSRNATYQAIARGEIKAIRLGRKLRVSKVHLKNLLEAAE